MSVLNPAIRGTATHCDTKLNEAYGSAATGAATTNVAYESIEEIEPRPEGLPHERGLQANVAYGSATGAVTTIHTNVAYDSIEGIKPRPEGLQHERGLQANEAYDSTTGIGTLC